MIDFVLLFLYNHYPLNNHDDQVLNVLNVHKMVLQYKLYMEINLFYQMFVLHLDLSLIYKFSVLLIQHVEYLQPTFHINHDHIDQIQQMNDMQL